MKTRMRPSRKAAQAHLNATAQPTAVVFHEIGCPIYRPVLVGEKILESDRRVWMDKLIRPDQGVINTICTGDNLYLRTITTLQLKVSIQ